MNSCFQIILTALKLTLMFSGQALAQDEIELRDGTVVSGSIIAQGNVTQIPTQTQSALFDSQEIWIATGDGVKKIKTTDIRTIHYGPKAVTAS